MARSYVDEWLDTQALSKCSTRHHEETNITIKRRQASGLDQNNGQKPNQCRNKDNYRNNNNNYKNKDNYRNRDSYRKQDNYRKRKRSSDDDLDNSYSSYYIYEVGDKVYKKARTDYRKPRVNSCATGVKDEKT